MGLLEALGIVFIAFLIAGYFCQIIWVILELTGDYIKTKKQFWNLFIPFKYIIDYYNKLS